MKRYYLLALILVTVLLSNAQTVNIPDANFKAALINHVPVIDTKEPSDLKMYPNPFSEQIIIDFEEVITGKVQVLNLLGKAILSEITAANFH